MSATARPQSALLAAEHAGWRVPAGSRRGRAFERLIRALPSGLALVMVECAHAPAVDPDAPLAQTCGEGRFFPPGALTDDPERKTERTFTRLYRIMGEPPLCDRVRGDAFRCTWLRESAFASRGEEVVRVSQEQAGPTIVWTLVSGREGAKTENDLEVTDRRVRVLSPAEWKALEAEALAAQAYECLPSELLFNTCYVELHSVELSLERSMNGASYAREWQLATQESSLRTLCNHARSLARAPDPGGTGAHSRAGSAPSSSPK